MNIIFSILVKFLSSTFCLEHAPLGGFFCDSKYIWLSKGPVLQIISTASHSKVSEWFFGNVLKDNTIYITSVAEIPRKSAGLPFLAVGLHSNIIGGFICIFDVALAKVIRTIDVKYNVSYCRVCWYDLYDFNLLLG